MTNLIEKIKSFLHLDSAGPVSGKAKAYHLFHGITDNNLAKKMSVSLEVPSPPKETGFPDADTQANTFFLTSITLGGRSPETDEGVSITLEYGDYKEKEDAPEKQGWYVSLTSIDKTQNPTPSAQLMAVDAKDKLTLTIQADPDVPTSQDAHTCVDWLLQVQNNDKPTSKLAIKIKTTATASNLVKAASIYALYMALDCGYLPASTLLFDNISLTSFKNEDITPNWDTGHEDNSGACKMALKQVDDNPKAVSLTWNAS